VSSFGRLLTLERGGESRSVKKSLTPLKEERGMKKGGGGTVLNQKGYLPSDRCAIPVPKESQEIPADTGEGNNMTCTTENIAWKSLTVKEKKEEESVEISRKEMST